MGLRLGRPTDSPKTIKLQIRVDQDTLSKLDDYADKLSSNRSEVIRKGITLVGESLK